MKKVVILVLLVILLTSLALGEDVGYILKSKRAVDSRITGVFTEMNLSYKLIEDKAISKENLASFKFLFIDDAILRNTAKIKIYNYPSVIMNQNYGYDWSLTDTDGISQLASSEPLSVKLISNGIKQVYTQATYSTSGVSIPYFYLDDLNKPNPSVSIARTYGGSPYEWGDVISVIPKGAMLNGGITTKGKMCFYGIAKTEYWTNDARNLFKDCVGGVLSKCSHDIECGTDGFTGNRYCMNGSVYQNYLDFSCANPDTSQSSCINSTQQRLIETCANGCSNGVCLQPRHDLSLVDFTGSTNKVKLEYVNGSSAGNNFRCLDVIKTKVHVKNNGNFIENASLTGNVDGITMSFSNIINSNPGDENERTSLSPYIALNLAEGYYNMSVSVNLPGDANLSDNTAIRQIFVSCPLPECTQDSDCGQVAYGNNYCIGKNVSRNITTPICTTFGICSNVFSIETVQICSDLCSNGECISIICHNNAECNDFNDRTQDTCVNPGTTASFCRNTPINCLSDNDCGFSGYTGQEFCSQNDVFKNYQNARCNNPGTLNSSCSISIIPNLIQDCDDSNSRTIDSCVEPPARCIHTIPACFLNSECSGGGSASFCSGTQFWINITKPVCLNPGKINAACSFNSKALFFENCTFGCSPSLGRCNPS